jgi:hypothetical protein
MRLLAPLAASLLLVTSVLADSGSLAGARLGADAALWNARVCVGEVGWRAPLEACSAMVWVHVKRAAGSRVTVATLARRYSRAVRRPPRRRAWVPLLRATGAAPVTWPPHLDGAWPRYRDRFAEILSHVEGVLRGDVPDPCPEVDHYGGPMDSVPTGRELDDTCAFEGTRQVFYRRATSSPGS